MDDTALELIFNKPTEKTRVKTEALTLGSLVGTWMECQCRDPGHRQNRADQQRRFSQCAWLRGLLTDAMRLGASARASLCGFGRRGRRGGIHGELCVRVQDHDPQRSSQWRIPGRR
jgi:hypothetical protein